MHPGVTQAIIRVKKLRRTLGILARGELTFYPPSVLKLERDFARLVGRKHGLTFCNGTSAIEAALFACGVGSGERVLVPSHTFHATIDPILTLGAEPVFVDIDPKRLTIDPEDLERKLHTSQGRYVLIFHPWGNPCDMDRLLALKAKHGFALIEDGSHAHGARYRGKRVGSFGEVGCFSLQGSKPVSAGEGGMAVTDDDRLHNLMLLFGHYGRTANLDYGYTPITDTGWGYKRRMNPLGAGIASVDLEYLDAINAKKRENYQRLVAGFSESAAIRIVQETDGGEWGGFYEGVPLLVSKSVLAKMSLEAFVKGGQERGIPFARYRYAMNASYPHLRSQDARRSLRRAGFQGPPTGDSARTSLPVSEDVFSRQIFLRNDYRSNFSAILERLRSYLRDV